MRKVAAHKKYYDKSYFYDSIHTENINVTLPMQKKRVDLGQDDIHYSHPEIKTKTIVSKVGCFIHFS